MRSALHLSFILSIIARAIAKTEWIYPGPKGANRDFTADETWALGDNKTLRWNTSASQFQVVLWQQRPVLEAGIRWGLVHQAPINGDNSGPGNYTWTVQTYTSNITWSPVYWFALVDAKTGNKTGSHYVNITQAAVGNTPASPTPSSHSAGLSTGAEAGVGVGVGLAALLVIGGLLAWFLQRRRKHRGRLESDERKDTGHQVRDTAGYQDQYGNTQMLPGELDGEQLPAEMDEQNRFELASREGREGRQAKEETNAVHELES